MPAERRKSEDAVSDFLEREREAMQAIENMAISTASEAKQTASVSKASSQQPAKPPIDWDQVEAYMLANVELDLETAKGDKDLEFLVQRYANGAPDTELWNNLLAENEKRIKEQRAKNEEYLAELRRKAADFIATIEAAEKKDYEESKRQFEEYHRSCIMINQPICVCVGNARVMRGNRGRPRKSN